MNDRWEPDWIVIGLGNPGREYASTRHNVGFRLVEALAGSSGSDWLPDRGLGADISAYRTPGGSDGVLVKPRTFMNRSGRAAASAMERWSVDIGRLIVAYDDVALPLGRLRVRPGGSSGGHNGIRSLIAGLGTEDFPRVRMGVAGEGTDEGELADYVLAPFEDGERETVARMVARGAAAVDRMIDRGVRAAMNEFNGPEPAAQRQDGTD